MPKSHSVPGSNRRGGKLGYWRGHCPEWNAKRAIEPWREYPDWRKRWADLWQGYVQAIKRGNPNRQLLAEPQLKAACHNFISFHQGTVNET